MNKAQDAQGFTNALEDSLGDYQAMMYLLGSDQMRVGGQRRLLTVDLAVKGRKGEPNWCNLPIRLYRQREGLATGRGGAPAGRQPAVYP